MKDCVILSKESETGPLKAEFPQITPRPAKVAILHKLFKVKTSEVKLLGISEKLKRKEIKRAGFLGLMVNSSASSQNNAWQGNSLDFDIKPMNLGDDGRLNERSFQFSDKAPTMVFRALAPQNNVTENPPQKLPHTSSNRIYEPFQKKESSAINIDFITDEVLRLIDHKLLVWRERTGRV